MKFFAILLIAAVLVSLSSCKRDAPSGNGDTLSVAIDTLETSVVSIEGDRGEPIVDTEKKEAVEAIVEEQVDNSPFSSLGCCSGEENYVRDCCCGEVIETYKKILKSGDEKLLLQVKTEDPIFSACKNVRKWRNLIENLDQPKPEESDEGGESFDF